MNLSVIIITRDEERDIAACLESVSKIAQEIVLVDSGSTDRTLFIARGNDDRDERLARGRLRSQARHECEVEK